MNQYILPQSILLLVVLVIFACSKGTKGEGNKVSETRDVPAFTKIVLDAPGSVYLSQGATQNIKIEAQPNIMELLSTEVSRNTLTIDTKESIGQNDGIIYKITVPKIEYLEVEGSGDIIGQSPFSDIKKFVMHIDGSGDIDMNVKARNVESSIDGSGTIRLKGSTENFEIDIDGSGDVETFELISNDCEVNISGSGNAEVTVSEDLEISISGSGDVAYKGSPKLKEKISGSGKIRQSK